MSGCVSYCLLKAALTFAFSDSSCIGEQQTNTQKSEGETHRHNGGERHRQNEGETHRRNGGERHTDGAIERDS